jgi:mRNA interferase HigB
LVISIKTISLFVRILARSTLRDFWELNPDSETGLRTWFTKIKKAEYKAPSEIITDFKGADYVRGYIVFNIAKNKYRLVAAFRYDTQICYVHFIGNHAEYDKIDFKTLGI